MVNRMIGFEVEDEGTGVSSSLLDEDERAGEWVFYTWSNQPQVLIMRETWRMKRHQANAKKRVVFISVSNVSSGRKIQE